MKGELWRTGKHVYGSNRLAHILAGLKVEDVETDGGWIGLTLNDGTLLHISAENGASLSLELVVPKDES